MLATEIHERLVPPARVVVIDPIGGCCVDRPRAADPSANPTRPTIRRTFTSIAATGTPPAIDATAAAVYGPTPGSGPQRLHIRRNPPR
jgi:hypothetical protein